jgi:hypothetical protein
MQRAPLAGRALIPVAMAVAVAAGRNVCSVLPARNACGSNVHLMPVESTLESTLVFGSAPVNGIAINTVEEGLATPFC